MPPEGVAYPAPEPLPPFRDPADLRRRAAEVLLPPNRMLVSEAAEKYRYLHNPGGGYSGPYRNDKVPYGRGPQDVLTSRDFEGMILASSAQSAKTEITLLNWVSYSVCCDPADMLLVEKTDKDARDFSKRRLDRMIDHSPDIRRRLLDDNVFDKTFRGMMVTIGAPTINTLSGKPIPRVAFTDYDRMPEDIDEEGAPFDLGRKRTQTFGSAGMTAAESSPGYPVLKSGWQPATPHEAPPTKGILALYNRGDRRRLYWPCPSCGEYFEGDFHHLRWPGMEKPDDDGHRALGLDPAEAALNCWMVCPVGCVIEPSSRVDMLAKAVWLIEGETITAAGKINGTPRQSRIASFWVKGVAAAFSTWGQLVERYLTALAEYETSGSETALKTTVNVDQGLPYLPKAADRDASVAIETLIARAESSAHPLLKAPGEACYLTAAVDVQANRFDVMVRAWGPRRESWIVDWHRIFKAEDDTRPVDPANHAEDWQLIIDRVLKTTYPVLGDASRRAVVARVMIDSAGAKGVTAQAYAFWRRCRKLGFANRILLGKGTASTTAPRIAERLPDTNRKDRKAKARGEVPVWFFQTDMLKDEIDLQLQVMHPGEGYVHLSPELLNPNAPHPFFEELTAEERTPAGKWVKVKDRNEVLDLMVMTHAASLQMKADRIDWDHPPAWAMPLSGPSPWIMASGEAAPGVGAPQKRVRRVRSKGI